MQVYTKIEAKAHKEPGYYSVMLHGVRIGLECYKNISRLSVNSSIILLLYHIVSHQTGYRLTRKYIKFSVSDNY